MATLAEMIPDKYAEAWAADGATQAIRSAGGDYTKNLAEQDHAERMIAHIIRTGGDLVDARGYAMSAALIRDARLTGPELHVRAEGARCRG